MVAPGHKRVSTRATGVVGIAILSSRILGLIREQIFAGLFGAGKYLDAFLMAFRLPNLFRDLFAEGALSTAFITTFSGKIATEGDESAWRLANKVATLTAVFMSAVTLLGIVFAPQLVDLLTWWSWPPDKTELTIWLTRIMWPFMLLVSLAALVMGMLNAKHVFGPPAMASSYFNLGSIIGGVGIGLWLDPHFGARSLTGLAIGTLIGGMWQLTAQFPSLRRVGYKYHADFQWRDKGVRAVLTLMAPAIIAASAVQVNVLINSGFAASLGNGPVSWLNIAFRLMQLPLGIFGVAIGTVTLPLVSKSAVVGNIDEFRSILATCIVATISFRLLYALMWRQTRGLESRRMFAGLVKICLAGLLLALICWLANHWWLDAWEHLRFFEKLFALFATILVSAAAFFGVAFLLHVDEVRDAFDLVKRKTRRGGV